MLTIRPISAAIAGLLLMASFGTGATAYADTQGNSNASCMGHEASWTSPPGSQEGNFAGRGMPGLLDFVDVVAELVGAENRGELIINLAQVNKDHTLATHHACDEALGIPEGAE
jgi:hypothetical protein